MAPVLGDGDGAGQDDDVGELVVDADGEADLSPCAHGSGDVSLERGVVADVFGDQEVVDVHRTLVGGGVDAQDDRLDLALTL